MSIAVLKKISVCGLIHEKRLVLDALQGLGCVHLVSLREPLAEPENAVSERPEDAYKALKFLTDCPNKRHQISIHRDGSETGLLCLLMPLRLAGD